MFGNKQIDQKLEIESFPAYSGLGFDRNSMLTSVRKIAFQLTIIAVIPCVEQAGMGRTAKGV